MKQRKMGYCRMTMGSEDRGLTLKKIKQSAFILMLKNWYNMNKHLKNSALLNHIIEKVKKINCHYAMEFFSVPNNKAHRH